MTAQQREERWKRIIATRRAGNSYTRTAEICGVSRETVTLVMKRFGLIGAGFTKTGAPRLLTPEQEAEAIRLYRGGLSCRAVAERIGCREAAVRRVLRRKGVTGMYRTTRFNGYLDDRTPEPQQETFTYNGRQVPGRREDWDEWELHYLYVEVPARAERRELTA